MKKKLKTQKFTFQKCRKKTCSETKQILMVSSQLSFPTYFELYSLRIKRKKIWTKNEQKQL